MPEKSFFLDFLRKQHKWNEGKMKEILFIVFAIILAFLLFRVILSKKKKSRNNVSTYVCSNCGKQDCICHKSNDTP